MDLQTLLSIPGLPGWFIIIAALIFVFKQIGLLDYILGHLKSQGQLEREQIEFDRQQTEAKNAAEQSEQIALWSQMTQLQTMTLHQNELLLEYIINTSSEWHSKHSDRLNEIIECQRQTMYELKHLAAKFTIMVGVVEQNYDKTVDK